MAIKPHWIAPLALWAVGAGAASAGQPSLAIASMTPNNVDSSVARLVVDALADELLRTGAFRVMERSQMEKVLAEQGFQQATDCDGGECAIRMGKLLGIDRIVLGSVGNVGTAYVVTAREVDVATGEILVSAKRIQKGRIEDLLIQLVPQIAKDLAASPGRGADAAKPDSGGSRAWMWWAAGAGVAAAGGATAFLLLSEDGSSSPPATAKSSIKVVWQQ